MVRVFGAKEKKKPATISTSVMRTKRRKILQQMARTYPDALIGYDQDIERKYHANPAARSIRRLSLPAMPQLPRPSPPRPRQG